MITHVKLFLPSLGNPDNALEQCVTLAWGGWHDNYCTALRGVICQLDAVYQGKRRYI